MSGSSKHEVVLINFLHWKVQAESASGSPAPCTLPRLASSLQWRLRLMCSCAPIGGYDEYFGPATDVEAVVYMMIMNQMLHDLFPTIITVGEDVSGMPTFSRYASDC